MKRLISGCLLAGLIGVSAQAMADEGQYAGTDAHMSQHQMMRDCMAKERAANSGASEKDMRKSCKDQVRAARSDQERDRDRDHNNDQQMAPH
jgi:hypothetical protein